MKKKIGSSKSMKKMQVGGSSYGSDTTSSKLGKLQKTAIELKEKTKNPYDIEKGSKLDKFKQSVSSMKKMQKGGMVGKSKKK